MKILVIWLLLLSTAMAQEIPTTAATRLSASLGQCIGLLEGRNDQIYDLQKKLDIALVELQKMREKTDAK